MSTFRIPDEHRPGIANLHKLLQRSASIVATEFGEGKTGGYICLCDSSGQKLVHRPFGIVPSEKEIAVQFFSQEKPLRLILVHPGDMLSFQSADKSRGQYQGGVRMENALVGGISGFKAPLDEAYLAALGFRCGFGSRSYFENAMEISSNLELYTKILKVLNQFK